MKLFLYCFFFLALGRLAFASETALTLLPPVDPIPAGQPTRVDLVAMNPGLREAPFEVEPALEGSIKTGDSCRTVSLRSAGSVPAAVPPGGFAVRRYTFDMPIEASGSVVLEVRRLDGATLRAVFEVLPAAPLPSARASSTAATALDKLVDTTPATSAIMQNFAGRFLANQPIYFIYGSGAQQAAKFQFSFDYRLATMIFGRDDKATVASLRLGYTQRSLWDIDAQSSPFYDTSYIPEVVVSTDSVLPRKNQSWTWLGLRTGFQHESNGQEGDDSRSLNLFYVRPRFVLGALNEWHFIMLPEVYAYIGDLGDNKALKDYRGYGKLRFYFGRTDGPTVMFTGWTGQEFDHGSYQLDLAVPVRIRRLNIESYFYLQYFNGYGESLRAFDKKSEALRAGFSLVR